MCRRSASWLRTVAAIVCLTFSFSAGAWSAPAATPATPASKPAVEEPSKLEVPSALATLQDSFISPKNTNKKLVIYIQDIHASVNVQEKIADLIHFYSTRYGMSFVAYEGNEGPIDTEKVFWFPDQKLKQAVSKKFMEELRLSGAEYARINATKPFQLWGAEDIRLYHRNLKLFQNAIRVRQEAANVLQELEKALAKSFEKVGSEEAKQLFHLQQDYAEKRVDLLPYIKELSLILKKKNITLSDLPRIGAILDIEKREQQMTDKTQRVSFECEIDQIKSKDFFEELKELEQRVRYASYQQAIEQKIVRALDRLKILTAMANLSATRSDLDQYWALKFKFSEIYFLSVIRSVDGQKNWHPRYQDFLDDLIQPSNDFYLMARRRDHVLANNLLKSLEKQQSAIFVAGGFHAPGITQKLKKEGISYLLISPKYSGVEKSSEKAYLDSIMKFSDNSQKISDFSTNMLREETVLNESSDSARVEVNQKALELQKRGLVTPMGNHAVIEDLKKLHQKNLALSAKAASLGEDPLRDLAFFRKTLLIPPATREARQKMADVKDLDSPWFDRPNQEQNIQKVIDHFNAKYPGMFPADMASYSYVQIPDNPVVLEEHNGRRTIKLDYDLFVRSGPALAGLIDVLYGDYLKTYPDGKPYQNLVAVRLFAFLHGFSFLIRTQEHQRGWLIERLESTGRPKTAKLLKNIWNGSQEFTMNLEDPDWKITILDVFGESWPEGSEWVQAYKGLNSSTVAHWLELVNTYLVIKSVSERIAAKVDDNIPERELLRYDIVAYLIKAKKYDTVAAFVKSVIPPEDFFEFLRSLCAMMWQNPEDNVLKLSPEDVGITLARLQKMNVVEGLSTAIKRYIISTISTPSVSDTSRETDMQSVHRAYKREVKASSLGARVRTVLVQINSVQQAKLFVDESRRFLAATQNTRVVFVSDWRLKANLEFTQLRRQFMNRVDVLSNKLMSSADVSALKEYIHNRKGDFALIAPLETLEKGTGPLKGVILLAADKVEGASGRDLEEVSGFVSNGSDLVMNKISSALVDTAWRALSGGAANAEFLSRTHALDNGQIYVITSSYLSEWFAHLFAEHTYQKQYQSAA